jgi:capsular exopolysaccharide synthesis family protein
MTDVTPYRGANGPDQRPGRAGRTGPGGRADRGPEPVYVEVEGIELREVVAVLRRHAWLVLGIAAATVGLSLFLVLNEEPQYRATSAIRLQDERGAMTRGLQGTGMQQALGRTEDALLSQVQVLRSRRVAGAVVDRLGLRVSPASPEFDRGLLADVRVADVVTADTARLRFAEDSYQLWVDGEAWPRARYGEPVSSPAVTLTVLARPAVAGTELYLWGREPVIDALLERLTASRREHTDVVDVSFTASSPVMAQRVANEMVEEFRTLNASTAQDQSRRRRVFVEEQLAQTDAALVEAQLELTGFREREQVYGSQQRLATQQAGLIGLEVRREELAADRGMFRTLLYRLQTAGDDGGRSLRTMVSAPGIGANPVIATLFEQLVRYETSLDSLTAGEWGAAGTNPDVARLRSLAATSRERLVDAVGSHVSALDARIAALDELKDRSGAELAALPATEAEEARLLQRLETVRRIADQLREEYQRARIAEAVEAGQVEIVDLAPLPTEPVGSRRSLKLALGLVLGLMLGSGAAFLRENLNTAIRRKEDIERMLRVPGLGVIPRIASKTAGLRTLPRRARAGGPNGDRSASLVAATDNQSSSAEAFRTLRTNLIFSQAVHTLRRIVVTSASEQEGKSTTAANLGVTFAQQGVRALLVDCDLRRPQLHAFFGAAREPGLTELVLGHRKLDDVVQDTRVEGLAIIASGTQPPNPSELLGGERIQSVLDGLGRDYDVVILDTPPILAASDAAVLGASADGVVLVIRAGQTERGAAQEAIQQLDLVGARIVGAVLNDPDAKVPSYGGNYYYHKYYGQAAGA